MQIYKHFTIFSVPEQLKNVCVNSTLKETEQNSFPKVQDFPTCLKGKEIMITKNSDLNNQITQVDFFRPVLYDKIWLS